MQSRSQRLRCQGGARDWPRQAVPDRVGLVSEPPPNSPCEDVHRRRNGEYEGWIQGMPTERGRANPAWSSASKLTAAFTTGLLNGSTPRTHNYQQGSR